MTKTKTPTVTTKKTHDMMTSSNTQIPEFLRGKMNDHRGSEEVTSSDMIIPRIELTQAMSKARKKADPNYIEGVEEGMMYNNVTRELYGTSIIVCPIFFKKEYLLWKKIDLGGGFGGAFPDMTTAAIALNEKEKIDEWDIVDTNQHFVLIIKPDGGREEAVLSMAKTKAKTSRKWNTLIRLNGGPRFSRKYLVEGVPDQNSSGQDYFTLGIQNFGFVDEETYHHAERVYEAVFSGIATIDRNFEENIGSDSNSEM